MHRRSPRSVVVAAVAACVLTLTLGAPVAAAADPPAQAPCGSLGPPVCDLLQGVKVALAPLEPVLAMGGPLSDALGAAVHTLQATIEQAVGDPEAVNAQDLAKQVGALLDQLSIVPAPVAATLSTLGLGGLFSILGELQSALAIQSSTPVEAAGSEVGTPTPVPQPTGLLARAAAQAGVAVPAVPVGAPLDLPDLALPDFGSAVTPSRSLGTPASTRGADGPSHVAAVSLRGSDDAAAVAAAMAIAGVLLSVGLLAGRVRSGRRTDLALDPLELVG